MRRSGSRTARDLFIEGVAAARLRCRFGAVGREEGSELYRHAVGRFFQRTGAPPEPAAELAAEVALLRGPAVEGAQPLPELPVNGTAGGPEWTWFAYHIARGTGATADVLAARLALVVAGYLRPEDAVAEKGGFLPLIAPAFDAEGPAPR